MKVRVGFVSNSSSSSFICVGVTKQSLIKKMLKHDKLKPDDDGFYDDMWGGTLNGSHAKFLSNSGDIFMAGIEGDELMNILNTNSLDETKNIVADKLNQFYNLEIKGTDVAFDYGETSSE